MRLFLVALLIACASCAQIGQANRNHYALFSDSEAPTPANGMGTVCFLMDGQRDTSTSLAGSPSYFVWEGRSAIGIASYGAYFCHEARPGHHEYWADLFRRNAVGVDVDPGEVTYIETKLGMPGPHGVVFEVLPPGHGKEAVSRLKRAEITPAGHKEAERQSRLRTEFSRW